MKHIQKVKFTTMAPTSKSNSPNLSSSSSSSATLLDELPREKWWGAVELYHYEGFWYFLPHLEAAIAVRSQFEACDGDVLLASSIKTGTTWLKALIPSIMNLDQEGDDSHDPLLENHPNSLIPSLELQIFKETPNNNHDPIFKGKPILDHILKENPNLEQIFKKKLNFDHQILKANPNLDQICKESLNLEQILKENPNLDPNFKEKLNLDQILKENPNLDQIFKESLNLDQIFKEKPNIEHIFKENPNFDHLSAGIVSAGTPRLFRTHLPYTMLPESVKKSDCKIVYITRDPKDTLVSLWHFINKNIADTLPPQLLGHNYVHPISEAFESYCKGIHPFGPFHDHVLGYWKESLKKPEKILFLKYEEMKRDPKGQVRKLASFLGRSIVKEEVLDKMLWRCSLERLKDLEVNKNGVDPWEGLAYSSYFRLGLVGDWKNSLSMDMKEKLDKITKDKLEGSGLDLEIS